MAHTHTTFGDLKTSLAARLGDSGYVHWSAAELGLYIVETLRVWGLLTGYWRDTGSVTTASGTAFYNVTSIQNSALESLLNYTVTDTDLATIIQYHLLEPATGSTWTGSEQFTLAEMVGALTKRRDQFLSETGAVLTHTTQVLGAGSRLFDLPDTALTLRRLAWTDSASVTYPLHPTDLDAQRNYSDTFLITQGIPATYSSASAKPLRYIVAPPSNQPGTLDILLIQSGSALTAAGVSLGIPDDMAWVVKWGALADMLGQEGVGQDLTRSYFCERRWRLGLELCKANPTVINAEINGIAVSTDAIANMDLYNPQWQSSTNTPEFAMSLRNYIALAPAPNGIFSVLLDVVRNAVVPTVDGDFLQIGREYLDSILDYAEHLAAFKSGGQEFRHTYRGATNFFNAAITYNEKLTAQNPAILELIKQSTLDDTVLPMRQPAATNRIISQIVPDE